MMKEASRLAIALCVAGLLALGAVACGSSDDGGAGTAAATGTAAASGGDGDAGEGLQTVKMGILGISADAPVWLGIEKGYFKDEGIDLQPQTSAAGGAAFVPALLSGDLQVGAGGADGAIQAIAKGLDVKILGENGGIVSHGHSAESTDDTDHITLAVMSKDPNIKTLKDLEGKTAAGVTVSGLQYLCVNQAMRRAGADPKKLKVLEVSLPDMLPALEAGRVDVAILLEPFVTAAKAAGAHVISYSCEEAKPGLAQGAYFISGKWADENPEIVKGLTAALGRANEYAEAHPDEQRRVIAKNTKIPPKLVDEMALYPFPAPSPETNGLDFIADMMVQNGLIEEKPDLAGALAG